MKHDLPTDLEPADDDRLSATRDRGDRRANAELRRAEPRSEFTTQAFVSIPPMSSRVYEIREISRSGMFLAFKDAQSALLEIERADIEPGANVDIAFAASVADSRQRFSVRGQIMRITRRGIGVQFVTRNPPQLAALRELFARAGIEAQETDRRSAAPSEASAKRTVVEPPSAAAWQDWDLLD